MPELRREGTSLFPDLDEWDYASSRLPAYRKLVRRYPPELNPERFARIHRAYELLSSLEQRMAEVRREPLSALAALFPEPDVRLRDEQATAEPEPADPEPLLGPLRLELLRKILDLPPGE